MNEAACPACGDPGCHYWLLRRNETWHPLAAGLDRSAIPESNYLTPIYRFEPVRPSQPFAIALDPREACYVIANGATLDGHRYRCSFDGWDGTVGPDGRVVVRCDPEEIDEHYAFVDASRAA